MPYDLLKSADGDAVVLVETGYGRALGPVLSGPDAEAVMEAFIAGLGVDPAIIPPWILEQRFHEFLTALNQESPPPPPRPAAEAAPDGGPEEQGEAAPDAETGDGEPTKPATVAGQVTCPQCDGWGTIAKDGQVVACPLCEGSGSVTQEVADAYRREQAG